MLIFSNLECEENVERVFRSTLTLRVQINLTLIPRQKQIKILQFGFYLLIQLF